MKLASIKSLGLTCLAGIGLLLGGCQDDAIIASRNISKAADNFEINRRIVFYNGITNDYVLSIFRISMFELDQISR